MSERSFPRFPLGQRVQHALLILSFTTLGLTGLSQTFAASPFGERIVAALGGIEWVRIGHRAAAVVLMVTGIWHLLDAAYHIFVLRRPLSMLPRAKDVVDFWQTLRYNLGRAAARPRMGRFTFEEKVEYWALLWGTGLMVATGFMLWNPLATTRFLPGQWIPAAQVVHAGEAILAVLAVIVWHGYGVHLRHFNRSMFTGTMTESEMRHEHPLELESLLADPPPAVDEVARGRRRRVFWPVCVVVTLTLAAGLVWFVTLEDTALPVKPSATTAAPAGS
ncbi:MAG TPA: cytochrome b/b6 domain-containing protein [Vicinamibacteria bacterium]